MKLIFDALIVRDSDDWLISDITDPFDTFELIEFAVCVIELLRLSSAAFALVTSDVIDPSATVILDIAVSAVSFAVSAVSFAASAVFFAASACAFATLMS